MLRNDVGELRPDLMFVKYLKVLCVIQEHRIYTYSTVFPLTRLHHLCIITVRLKGSAAPHPHQSQINLQQLSKKHILYLFVFSEDMSEQ